MKIELIDPKELKVHALLKSVPDEWADDEHPEFLEFRTNIKQNGILDALQVTPDNKIVDGRRRCRAANLLDIREVPITRVEESQVSSVILAKTLRREYKSQSHRAYALYPIFEPAHLEALAANRERLKSGGKADHFRLIGNGQTTEAIARNAGVSRDLFEFAAKVHSLFAEDKELKAQCEPKILAGEMALGAVVAGAAGKELKGKPRPKVQPFRILETAAVSVINQIEELGELSEMKKEERDEFRQYLVTRFLDYRKFDAEKCQAAARRLKTFAAEFELLAKRAGKKEAQ